MRRTCDFRWILSAILGGLFVLTFVFLPSLQPVDAYAYRQVSRLYSPFFTGFFHFCTALASPGVLLFFCLAMVVCLRRSKYAIPLVMNLILSVVLNLALKSLFLRPRPSDVVILAIESGYSFPSGHTMSAACFYGFLIFLLPRVLEKRSHRMLLGALLSLVILLVGISRVYLGVHFFTDIFAGLCISIVYLLGYTALVERYLHHPEASSIKAEANGGTSLQKSFSFAFQGIRAGMGSERNMLIHLGAMALVTVFGAVFALSKAEWITCILLFGLVFMAELFNTAIETVVDIAMPRQDPRAKLAKDTAAGAVLAISLAAAAIGVIIFAPKVFALLHF